MNNYQLTVTNKVDGYIKHRNEACGASASGNNPYE